MQTGLDVSQPSPSEWAPSQSAGRQRMSWVLRQYPFSQHAGQHLWIRSLLDTCRRAGWSIDLLVPAASLLPLVVGQSAQLRVHAPGLRAVTVHRSVTTGGAAARQAAWVAFARAPQPVQHRLASARRRRRGARGVDHVLGRPWTTPELQWIDATLAALQPTVVVFDSLFALAPTANGVRRLALAHDVISERAASLARSGYRTTPKFVDRTWEAQQVGNVDAIVAIQWEDAATLRRMAAQPHIVVAPPAFDPRPGYGHRIEMPAGKIEMPAGKPASLSEAARYTTSTVFCGFWSTSGQSCTQPAPAPSSAWSVRLPVRSPPASGCHAGRRSR